MNTYISILRGINVSGQKMIKMDALKKMYEDLGFAKVQTYIQSGNVIFQSEKSEQKDLEKLISAGIAKQFGFEVPVIVLNIQEFKRVIQNNPFVKDDSKDISHQYATFLSSEPILDKFESIKQVQNQGEQIHLIDKIIYFYCPSGYGRTKLNNTFFESKLKTVATTRNWKTTLELLNIAGKY
jgi:uncharacterized protein (DUF1697 family)